MGQLTDEEIEEMQALSKKIDNGTAKLKDYKRYEELLIKAGFSQERVRERMNEYGYGTYEEYIRAKANAETREDRRIVNVVIVSSLVALCGVVMYFLVSGKIRKAA